MQFFGTRRTPPGVRGLKLMSYRLDLSDGTVSHPTRGAWIEIHAERAVNNQPHRVAPHPGCVD